MYCVQLFSSKWPSFLLHVMPACPDASNQRKLFNNYSQMISRAGEGPGLQVFPGSVPEVAQVRTQGCRRTLGLSALQKALRNLQQLLQDGSCCWKSHQTHPAIFNTQQSSTQKSLTSAVLIGY
jgi:hypothetical protein